MTALVTAVYERLTGTTVRPASPERLFIQWISSILVQERVLANYAANQNIPSRAAGENLDALAELTNCRPRPEAEPAVCTVRFSISQAQDTAILIPAGTRVTDTGGGLAWATHADAYIAIGDTFADVPVRCLTPGTVGNGYAPGQIATIVDLYDYYSGCENITESGGGADRATDEEYYQLMRTSMDSYSCAGAKGGYVYFAKQVSTEIADVIAASPTPGVVKLYVLMAGGELAGEEIKRAVLAACSADDVRPLTDQVFVEDAGTVPYNVRLTYYTQTGTAKSGAEIAAAVQAAVDEYTAWQSARLGRDINPSYLTGLLMQTGVKRVELAEPVFTVLKDGSGTKGAPAGAQRSGSGGEKEEGMERAESSPQAGTQQSGISSDVPEVAKLGTVAITNGGLEDE